MEFFHIQAKSKEEAEVFLYGGVGTWDRINAKDFIAKLQQLQKDYKKATFRLHSPGGSIFEGMAIYDAMRNSPLKIRIQVDGMAASMGSIIALGGDEITITENARIMIHQGRGGVAGSAKEMRNYAKLLESMNEQLAGVYAERTGKTTAWILENWMAEGTDTWFTAKEAKEEKLVDEIVKGKVQKQAAASLQGIEAMAAFYDAALEDPAMEIEPIKDVNKDKMKLIAKHLGLPEEATEQQVIDAIEGIRKEGSTNSVAALMLLGKKSGLITDENEAVFQGLAEKDFSGVQSLIENHKVKAGEQAPDGHTPPKPEAQHESLVDAIKKLAGQAGKGGNTNDRSDWTFADWQEKDEAGLLKMKADKPAEYESMVKAYYGSSVKL